MMASRMFGERQIFCAFFLIFTALFPLAAAPNDADRSFDVVLISPTDPGLRSLDFTQPARMTPSIVNSYGQTSHAIAAIKVDCEKQAKPADSKKLGLDYSLFALRPVGRTDLYLDGKLFATIGRDRNNDGGDEFRPAVVKVPELCKSSGKNHVIQLNQYLGGQNIRPSTFKLGQTEVIRDIAQVHSIIGKTTAEAFKFFCLVIGVFLLFISQKSDNASVYMYAGCASIAWVLYVSAAHAEGIWSSHVFEWRLITFAIESAFLLLFARLQLAFVDLAPARRGVVAAIALLGLSAILLATFRNMPAAILDYFLRPIVLIVFIACTVLMLQKVYRQDSMYRVPLILQGMISGGISVRDYVASVDSPFNRGDYPYFEWYQLVFEMDHSRHIAFSLMLLIIMGILVREHYRFYDSSCTGASEAYSGAKSESDRGTSQDSIYQELHDGVASHLVAALHLSRAAPGWSAAELAPLLENAMVEMRAILRGHASHAGCDGLTILQGYLDTQSKLLDSLQISFSHFYHYNVAASILPSFSRVLLRMIQESITNAIKHAQCSSIAVVLVIDESCLVLTIVDDGRGFDASQPCHKGMGLSGLRKRAAAIDGMIEIQSGASGTTVRMIAPLWGYCEGPSA